MEEMMGDSHQRLISLQEQFYNQLRQQNKSLNTLKNYRTDLDCFNNFLIDVQDDLKIDGINLSTVKSYGSFLDKKYTSDNSRRRRIQTLRIFFDFLVDKNIYPENVVRKLVAGPKFLDKPRPTPLKDLAVLWKHLTELENSKSPLERLCGLRNQVIFKLIYGSGLKVSDLSGLKQKHIDVSDNPRVIIIPPRRDPYSIPLDKNFLGTFKTYSAFLAEQKDLSNLEFEQLLFNANAYRILSGGLSPRGIESIFKELSKKLKISVTPKSLRQACIYKWINQKKSYGQIKEWLGVAPSYSLKLYVQNMEGNIFDDSFYGVESSELVQ